MSPYRLVMGPQGGHEDLLELGEQSDVIEGAVEQPCRAETLDA